ncbi:FYN-binding protein 1-like isoform X3 [Ylistrum balloti]|uniref:FYN-binding protein 1-like isoform X3 n=1 Tax=Ylistrum balloti TaxID=509963 RepID=UPI0029058B5F|nr:FYN-binding protein 1-like isoform X3 [Ylistrum balloti]
MEWRRYGRKRDDIYDDGSNIKNVTAVSRMRTLFEAPAANTKPFKPPPKSVMRPIPAAANSGPSTVFPKAEKAEEAGKTPNGLAEGNGKGTDKTSDLPSWKNRVEMFNKPQLPSPPPKTAKPVSNSSAGAEESKDENSNTVSANPGKRSSKVNIPSAFSGEKNTPLPIAPKKPSVFPRSSDKSEKKSGDEVPPVKNKPLVPSRGKTPAEGTTNIHEELKKKFSGKDDDIKLVKPGGEQKDPVRPGKLNMNSVLALQKKMNGSNTNEEPNDDEQVELRQKSGSRFPNRKSVKRKSLTRTNDGSKFYVVEMSLDNEKEKKESETEPDIPPPLVYGDLQRLHEIIQEYKAALRELEGNPTEDSSIVEEIEDVYEAIPADMDEPLPPPHKKLSRAVSLIKPMSVDEEYDSDEQDTYDDTSNYVPKNPTSNSLPAPPDLDLPAPPDELLKPPVPEGPIPTRRKPPVPPEKKPVDAPSPLVPQADDWPEDVYDDCATEQSQDQSTTEAEPEQDDVYEAIPGEAENIPPPTPEKPEKKEEKKEEKLSAKEKKKKEKEEAERLKAEKKKQEAEKKRQDKEIKEIKKNFKIDASQLDKSQGEGLLKEDAVPSGGKTAKLELTAKKGTFLKVIRLVDNPPGKWLVRLTEDEKSDKPVNLTQIVGYVDANIVEVMAGSYKLDALNDTGDGEEYQDVEIEVPPVEEEMYEAV